MVVGYDTQKKVNLTGSVASVSAEDLANRPIVSSSTALQGIAPGVTVTTQSGAPGGDGGMIRVRGTRNLRRFERRAAGAHRRGGGQPRCRRRHADRPDFGVEGRRLVGHLRFTCGQRRHPRDDQARQEGADVGHLPRLRRLAVAHRHARNGQRRGVHDPQPRNVVQRRQGVDLYRRLHCPLPREQPYRSRQLSAHRLAGPDSHRIWDSPTTTISRRRPAPNACAS